MNDVQTRIHNLLNNTQRDALRGKPVQPLSKSQIKTLNKFYDYYSHKPSKKGGINKPKSTIAILQALRTLGLFINKPYEKATQKDIIGFVKHLRKKRKESTVTAYKISIRTFYKWMHGIKEKHKFPPIVDHELLVPERVPNKIKRTDLPTKEVIQKMVTACTNIRAKAIVMCSMEGGLRGGELASINVGGVEFDNYGCKLNIEESKTKVRPVRLIESTPYIQEWLSQHPFKHKPKIPLFCGTGAFKGKRVKTQSINDIIKRAARSAGIPMRVHTHLLRHVSVTRANREGLDHA